MEPKIACPPTEEFQQLLDGTLSSDKQQACAEHLEHCPCCQKRLEAMATGGTNLSSICQHCDEAEPLATSAYWPALKALNEQVAQVVTPPPGAPPAPPKRVRDVKLDFLQPAADSAYLGRLAHFDVMRVLGRGGMGVVLEAFDSRLQRNVALKVLDPELADDETARQRFCREARAAASVTHENVVAVHQVEKSSDEGLPYLVMQLVAGESLEQRLARQQRMPLREIVRISMQAAHGLAAAHAQNLIHRDIKPGNILLEPNSDRVKLTDFGLARLADDVKLTRTGFVSGTPLYMSPEQALGDEADARSDLFSLGAVMYEMCAGKPPFAGNSALAILKQISEVKHRPLREANPEVPDWLALTIDRLLAKKPGERIQTAAQLAELLEFEWALMKTTSEDVPTVCKIEQARRTRRNRWIAVGIGALFLSAGLFAGAMLNSGKSGASTERSSADPVAVLSANSGAAWSVSFNPDHTTVAMAVEDGSLRLWDLATRSVKSTVRAHRGVVWSAQFARDGSFLATAGDDGLIKLWRLNESEPFQTFKHNNAIRGMALSTDDRLIFAGDREGVLRVWSVETGEVVREAQQPGAIYAVALSPDGKTLATAGTDKAIRLWNADSLTVRLPLEGYSGPVHSLAFHPTESRLVSAGWDRMIHVWDTGSGLLAKSWNGHDGDVWTAIYSPDGSRIASAGHDGAIRLWTADGKQTATYLGHKIAVHTITFSQDGKLLASGGRDGAVRVWQVE